MSEKSIYVLEKCRYSLPKLKFASDYINADFEGCDVQLVESFDDLKEALSVLSQKSVQVEPSGEGFCLITYNVSKYCFDEDTLEEIIGEEIYSCQMIVLCTLQTSEGLYEQCFSDFCDAVTWSQEFSDLLDDRGIEVHNCTFELI